MSDPFGQWCSSRSISLFIFSLLLSIAETGVTKSPTMAVVFSMFP